MYRYFISYVVESSPCVVTYGNIVLDRDKAIFDCDDINDVCGKIKQYLNTDETPIIISFQRMFEE